MRIGVLGAGSWGVALAQSCAAKGAPTTLWARDPAMAAKIAAAGESPRLPGIPLDRRLKITSELSDLSTSEAVLLVVPAQTLGLWLGRLAPHLAPDCLLVDCAKGVERGSLRLGPEVMAAAAPGFRRAVLSGPSFAGDVARGKPTAVALAIEGEAGRAQAALSTRTLRLYPTDDLTGAAVGGAVKNVVAIACGVADGLALGESARAALIARGFAEIARLGLALGARMETLAGLAGLGDLALTCASAQSRNYSLGRAIGAGGTAQALRASATAAQEGAETAAAAAALAARAGVEAPIMNAVADLVDGRATAREAMSDLLDRPLKSKEF